MKSCVKFCVKPLRTVKKAKKRIVACRMLTRPYRSDSMPLSQPPSAERSSVTVPSWPACAAEMPQSAISVGIVKL